jgi:hypothetical protein
VISQQSLYHEAELTVYASFRWMICLFQSVSKTFQRKMLGAPDEVALAIMAVYRFFRGSGSIQTIG